MALLEDVPAELQEAMMNPMRQAARKRAAWVASSLVPVPILARERRPVDVLWFVECYPSHHPRGQDHSRARAS